MNNFNKVTKLFVSTMMIVNVISANVLQASVAHAEDREVIVQDNTNKGTIKLNYALTNQPTSFSNGQFNYGSKSLGGVYFRLDVVNDIYDDQGNTIYFNGQNVGIYETDDNGNITIDDLPAGTYRLTKMTKDSRFLDDTTETTETIHHDETGHWYVYQEMVEDAWVEQVYKGGHSAHICNDCGKELTEDEMYEHATQELLNGGKGSWSDVWVEDYETIHHDPVYEERKQWVVESPAYDEVLTSTGISKEFVVNEGSNVISFDTELREYSVEVNSVDQNGEYLDITFGLYASRDITNLSGDIIVKKDQLIGASHSSNGKQVFDVKLPGTLNQDNEADYYVKVKDEAGLLNTDAVAYITTTGDTNKVVDMTLDCTKLKIEINKGEDANFDKVNYELILEGNPSVSYVGEGGTNNIYLNKLVPGKYILHLKKLGYKDLIETVIINNVNNLHYFEYQMEKISGQWVLDGDSWWYQFEDGSYPKNTIYMIDNKEYLFDMWGWMSTGWVQYNNEWYYCDNSGVMQKNWQYINNNWYYFNESGKMTTGWQLLGNQWYYLDDNGAMVIDWQYINNKWYYFNESGKMATGWQLLGNQWYFLDDNGAMVTGWQYINNNWYYFNESGEMTTGWQLLGNQWYYLDGNGSMVTGWQYINDNWYYFDESGCMTSYS